MDPGLDDAITFATTPRPPSTVSERTLCRRDKLSHV